MEVQDHTDSDGNVESINAEPGAKYPIRILHYANGLLVMGFVIKVFPETTMVLRPYVVSVNYDRNSDNITEYELTPYLDQIMYYDPLDLTPSPFMNASMVSITRPSQHLLENYTSIVSLKEALSIHHDEDEVKIFPTNHFNPRTRH